MASFPYPSPKLAEPDLWLPPNTPVSNVLEHARAFYMCFGPPHLGDMLASFTYNAGLCRDQVYQEYLADRLLSGFPLQTYSHAERKFHRGTCTLSPECSGCNGDCQHDVEDDFLGSAQDLTEEEGES